MYKMILASASPRRREILEQIGVEFSTMSSRVEEIVDGNDPQRIVKQLSMTKAEDVADQYRQNNMEDSNSLYQDVIIVGADTIVVHNGNILGKPAHEKEAKSMLRQLQGNTHQVFTGVCVLILSSSNKLRIKKAIQFVEETKVSIYPMSEEQIEEYVASGEPMDKAGAYAIQGRFAKYVTKINGDYYNVVGFPVAKFFHQLKEIGVNI